MVFLFEFIADRFGRTRRAVLSKVKVLSLFFTTRQYVYWVFPIDEIDIPAVDVHELQFFNFDFTAGRLGKSRRAVFSKEKIRLNIFLPLKRVCPMSILYELQFFNFDFTAGRLGKSRRAVFSEEKIRVHIFLPFKRVCPMSILYELQFF